jgi:hypothetical protein
MEDKHYTTELRPPAWKEPSKEKKKSLAINYKPFYWVWTHFAEFESLLIYKNICVGLYFNYLEF